MIFGRQPAAIVGAIQAALALALSFGWLDAIGLGSQDSLAVVMLVVNAASALYLAWSTSESLLAPAIEFIKAVITLGAIYGLAVTTEQTGLIVAVVTAGFGLVHQGKTSPLAEGTFERVPPGDYRIAA